MQHGQLQDNIRDHPSWTIAEYDRIMNKLGEGGDLNEDEVTANHQEIARDDVEMDLAGQFMGDGGFADEFLENPWRMFTSILRRKIQMWMFMVCVEIVRSILSKVSMLLETFQAI